MRPIRRIFALGPLALVLAFGLSVGARPTAAATPGDGLAPVRRYVVTIRPSFADCSVEGKARIELNPSAIQAWPLRIPRNDLVVKRMRVDGRAAAVPGTDGFIEIPRCTSVEITFSAHTPKGLQLSGKTLYSVFSTSHWMPCLEEPSVRVPLTLTLELPDRIEAVATGRLVSRRKLPPETPGQQPLVAWRFELDSPYPSYLYGFAAGPFVRATLKHGPVELVAVSDTVPEAKLRGLLDETARMVDFFAERAGVPYPLPSYTEVLVQGDAAQEMAGVSILGIDGMREMLEAGSKAASKAATEGKPVEDWLPAHELSHAWWGNLITCRTWAHFWLNEGFAVFMTAAWKERRWGEAGYQVEMDRARARWKRAQEAGADHPLAWGGKYPSPGLRNCIVYSKAALFLDELRRTLGDERFWRGVRIYTRAERGRSVVSGDFERAMQSVSRKDLRPLFQEWVGPEGEP